MFNQPVCCGQGNRLCKRRKNAETYKHAILGFRLKKCQWWWREWWWWARHKIWPKRSGNNGNKNVCASHEVCNVLHILPLLNYVPPTS